MTDSMVEIFTAVLRSPTSSCTVSPACRHILAGHTRRGRKEDEPEGIVGGNGGIEVVIIQLDNVGSPKGMKAP